MRQRLSDSTTWKLLRPLIGVLILAVIVWRLGTGPFVEALRSLNGWVIAAAVVITFLTTLCSAWRWMLVSRGLGVDIDFRTAVASYYRSQFLNTTLPGGVVGDVHRGVRHGENGSTARSLRAVAWERTAGQLVLAALTFVVLIALPSPLRSHLPLIAAALIGTASLLYFAGVASGRSEHMSKWLTVLKQDVRHGVLAQSSRGGVLVSSLLVALGYCSIFLLAAHAVGVTASITLLLPLSLFVLMAMAVPTNIGGWGPREGAAAWVFAEAGLGATQGVSTAAVYGVLTVIACLPGALVLVADRFGLAWQQRPVQPVPEPAPALAPEGATHG